MNDPAFRKLPTDPAFGRPEHRLSGNPESITTVLTKFASTVAVDSGFALRAPSGANRDEQLRRIPYSVLVSFVNEPMPDNNRQSVRRPVPNVEEAGRPDQRAPHVRRPIREDSAIDPTRTPFSLLGEDRRGISCRETDNFGAGLKSH